jgi:hypothetical protein
MAKKKPPCLFRPAYAPKGSPWTRFCDLSKVPTGWVAAGGLAHDPVALSVTIYGECTATDVL